MREQRKETEKKWGIGRKEHNNPQACETVHLFDQALCLVTSLSCLLTKYFLRCICVCKLTLLVILVWVDSVPVTGVRLRCLGALGLCCQLLNQVEVLTPDNSVETNKQNKQTNKQKTATKKLLEQINMKGEEFCADGRSRTTGHNPRAWFQLLECISVSIFPQSAVYRVCMCQCAPVISFAND